MENEIKKCVIISGAPEDDVNYYKSLIGDRIIISADSGYLKCKKLSIEPNLIIGDFDSSKEPETDIEKIVLPVRKDDTDTFYTLKEALKRGFNDILILGAIGSRFDHSYANILSLNYAFHHNAKCVIQNKNNRITLFNKEITIDNRYYKYFSLYSLFEDSMVDIEGSAFDVKGFLIKPGDQIAQSNEFFKNEVTIKAQYGEVLLIQSND